AEAQAKLLEEQKAKKEAEAQAKLLEEQKAKEEAEAQAKLLEEQKAKEEAEAQAKLLAEQKVKEEAEAQAKLLEEQKAKEEAEAQAKLLEEQKAKKEAEAQAKLLEEQKVTNEAITSPTDDLGKSMLQLTQRADKAKAIQTELLKQFDVAVEIKNQNLKDLKEENDLSEQGIAVQPKPFKSVTAENNALKALKVQLDEIIEQRSQQLEDLKSMYNERSKVATQNLDEVNLFYKKEIERLTAEQLRATTTRSQLESRLEEIRIATEFEKRRRIKRAAFDNEEERFAQDRATLESIRTSTATSETALTSEDFDFGEALGNNIKILKNINNVDSGFYLIIAVHTDKAKRNEFLSKVVASGRDTIDFFFDVNTNKYYIFYEKFDSIEAANNALKRKGSNPYNINMSLVKIENQ
ncbi:MAG: hypothetical protein HKN40_02865, partial [Winogradskyella sp.]|nr:hypothetical protein [Winogradskyella sp.]